MRLPRWIAAPLAFLGIGCGTNLLYQDALTPAGIPNFHVFLAPMGAAPGIYRTGLPPTAAAWTELVQLVGASGHRVTKVVLHDPAEGDESPAGAMGWDVVWIPLVPQGDRPLTVFEKPNDADVHRAVQTILDSHARGDVVVFGCQHDRERGGLVAALTGIAMFGWSNDYAWKYMIDTGSRIEESPGLLAYWIGLTNRWRP